MDNSNSISTLNSLIATTLDSIDGYRTGIVLHVSDAEHVDQEPDARDDQRHDDRQLIDLQCGVDVQVADHHPREQVADEGFLGVRARQRKEHGHGNREGDA